MSLRSARARALGSLLLLGGGVPCPIAGDAWFGRGTLALVVMLSASAVSGSLVKSAGMARRRALA